MNWQGKQILVTGAGGFIGSHLTGRLVAEDAQVRAFVRYNSRRDVGLLRLVPPDVYSHGGAYCHSLFICSPSRSDRDQCHGYAECTRGCS